MTKLFQAVRRFILEGNPPYKEITQLFSQEEGSAILEELAPRANLDKVGMFYLLIFQAKELIALRKRIAALEEIKE
jgi:hypothetical protein